MVSMRCQCVKRTTNDTVVKRMNYWLKKGGGNIECFTNKNDTRSISGPPLERRPSSEIFFVLERQLCLLYQLRSTCFQSGLHKRMNCYQMETLQKVCIRFSYCVATVVW